MSSWRIWQENSRLRSTLTWLNRNFFKVRISYFELVSEVLYSIKYGLWHKAFIFERIPDEKSYIMFLDGQALTHSFSLMTANSEILNLSLKFCGQIEIWCHEMSSFLCWFSIMLYNLCILYFYGKFYFFMHLHIINE